MRQPDFGSQTASPPFVGCTVLTQRGAAGAIFLGAGPRHVRLRTCSLASSSFTCNLAQLRCGRRSGPKEFARGPPGMAIEDVPFKRAVRAGMPPHVEQSLFHRAPVMRLILRRVPASGKDLHRLFARSLRAMPRMAAVTTDRKTDQPKPRLAASCGFRPSIRLTRCIGRGHEIHVTPLPRAPILGAPLRPGPAHVLQLRPVGVEQGVREGAEQPRSAAMEESVDLNSRVRSFCVPTLVAIRQVPVLFIGVKHLCFEARVSRRGTTREQPCLLARLGARGGCFSGNERR